MNVCTAEESAAVSAADSEPLLTGLLVTVTLVADQARATFPVGASVSSGSPSV